MALTPSCKTLPTQVTVDDHTLYYLKQASPDDWATELHFLTTAEAHLSQTQWDDMSEGQVCMGLSDWSDINQMISQFCSAPGVVCNYAVKQALARFFRRLDTASRR